MKKSNLVRILAEKEDLPKNIAQKVVELLFAGFSEELIRGGRIEVRGLGSFKVRHYQAYDGRNPKSGQPRSVPAKRLPVFKVSKNLHERLNGG